MRGTVKFYNTTKGFGFIAADDGKEYFVHQTALAPGLMLRDNDPVEFDVEEGDRGLKAVNVRKAEGGAPAEAPMEEAAEEPAEEEATEEDSTEEDSTEEDDSEDYSTEEDDSEEEEKPEE